MKRLLLCLVASLTTTSFFTFASEDRLPNTGAFPWSDEDLSGKIMEGAHRFVDASIQKAQAKRLAITSQKPSEEVLAQLRQNLISRLGLDRSNRESQGFEKFGFESSPGLVASTNHYQIWQVRWRVTGEYYAEGLLVEPKVSSKGKVWIALPDADETPELVLSVGTSSPPHHEYLAELANSGYTILVPTLINREEHVAARPNDKPKPVGQSKREWLHRQGFHMGSHLLSFEVLAVQTAIDLFEKESSDVKIHLSGYGEGGLIALLTSAVDTRVNSSIVSGFFGEEVTFWEQPLFRNIFAFEREIGLQGLLCLHTNRPLLIHAIAGPKYQDSKGWLSGNLVKHKIDKLMESLDGAVKASIFVDDTTKITSSALEKVGIKVSYDASQKAVEVLKDLRKDFQVSGRHEKIFNGIEQLIQRRIREADIQRDERYLYKAEPSLRRGSWSTHRVHPTIDPKNFIAASTSFRKEFWEEAMGRFDEELLPLNPRSRKILDHQAWQAFDVLLDVYPELKAWGVLLLPKDIKPNEKRPVVVLQHGRNGIPRNLIDAAKTGYADAAAELAKRGFIVFVPHNLYRGEDLYRWLDRKANAIGGTLFSFITASHQQILHWLKTLPQVDEKRIAFYGLSYGGESAMRLPAILEDYSVVICSGDFNQWTRKVAATDYPSSFMFSIEWEMPYWNLGNTFDYAEMAYLIFPRPFMVERGHHDLVAPDSWVAYEYAKVKYLYDQFALGDKTEILMFQGGHAMANPEAFDFLHLHLNWPKKNP